MTEGSLVAAIRSDLESERVMLKTQLEELGFGDNESPGLAYDPNFADTSQVTAERGEAAALASSLRERLVEIDNALHKLGTSMFGSCEKCGKQISEARLEAMPTSRFCIECASRAR